MATLGKHFGKTYLTLSRKIYFKCRHRILYSAYFNLEISGDFNLKKKKRLKVKSSAGNIKVSNKWTVIVTVLAFVLSVSITVLTDSAEKLSNLAAVTVLFLIVILGILFDIAGVAVSTASEEPFHAMAAKKIAGAKESIKIIRAAQQISSLCNDVIGDIAGIVSGSMVAAVVIKITYGASSTTIMIIELFLTGLVSAVMIGGKAAGKGFAMTNNNMIVFILGKIMHFLKKLFTFKRK